MPQAEHEGEVAFGEPEHPERQILDRFFDKLAEGDLSGAAKELRTLHEEGGSLCRSDVEIVADLLDGSAPGNFPYQLGFAKRGRGRPRHGLQSQLQAPWNAFSGDEIEASKALRKLDALEGTDVGTLAGLLGDDPALHERFPWRLVLKRPRRGRPKKTMRTGARQFATALVATEARSRHKHAKRAIGEVCDRTKLSRPTVYKAEKAMRDKSRIT